MVLFNQLQLLTEIQNQESLSCLEIIGEVDYSKVGWAGGKDDFKPWKSEDYH